MTNVEYKELKKSNWFLTDAYFIWMIRNGHLKQLRRAGKMIDPTLSSR